MYNPLTNTVTVETDEEIVMMSVFDFQLEAPEEDPYWESDYNRLHNKERDSNELPAFLRRQVD